jgi:hypothetical protein
MIEQARAGGFAFSLMRADTQVDARDPLAGVADGLGNLLGKYAKMKKGSEADFLKAMSDHAAGAVEESSWLTPDAYTQGVAYSKFIDEQSKLTAALPDISRQTLDSGGDITAFKTKLQPILQQLGKSLEESGLTGDALVAAQKQNITFIASAMDTFQKQREVTLKQTLAATSYKTINGALTAAENAADPQAFTSILGTAMQQLVYTNRGASDDPVGLVSNVMADGLKAYAKSANPATPKGQQAIQKLAVFADSDYAKQMSPKAYADIQEVLAGKQQDVMGYNANMQDQELTKTERAIEAGELNLTSKDFKLKYDSYQSLAAQGIISAAESTRLINRLQNIEAKHLKASNESTVALTGDYNMRASLYGSDADSKSADAVVKQGNKLYKNYDEAARFIIQTGLKTQNGVAVREGFKQYVTQMDVLFSTKPEDFDKGLVDGSHIQAYQGYVKQVQALQSGNSHMLGKALDAISDKDTRDAVEAYFMSGAKVGENVSFDMKEIQRYKEQINSARNGGAGSSLTGLKRFTIDDIKSGFFATHALPFDSNAGNVKPKNWFNNPSDEVLQKRVDTLNMALDAARPELAAMAADGQVLVTPVQQMRALRQLGRIVPIDTGFVTANKGWRDSVRIGNTTTAVPDELLQRSLEVIRDRYHTKFNGYGGRSFKPEDVQMTVVGNELLISATDSTGQRMTTLQRYGTSVVNETAWQVNESRMKDQGRLPIGTVQSNGGKFTITKDWNDAFGAELGKTIANSFVQFEGNIPDIRATDKSRPNVVTTSIGIRMDGTHGDWQRKILEGKKNGTEDQVVGAFVKDYYKGFNSVVKSANLPEAKNLGITGLTNAYVGLAHAMWQGGARGGGNAYASMLKTAQSNPKQAVEQFYKSALFKDIDSTSKGKGVDHPRTKMYIQGIMDVAAVYNAKAVAALKR